MVFKSDKQRKAFFSSRGNVRSNVSPKIIIPTSSKDKLALFNKLMLRRSFRESTPMTRELKFRRALARRKIV